MNKAEAVDILKDYVDLMDIQRLLLSQYKLDPNSRVRRGPLQRDIATHLNLTINPRFYSLLNKVMDNLPIQEIKVQGISHYKGIAPRLT